MLLWSILLQLETVINVTFSLYNNFSWLCVLYSWLLFGATITKLGSILWPRVFSYYHIHMLFITYTHVLYNVTF